MKYVKNVNMYMGIQAANVVMREVRISAYMSASEANSSYKRCHSPCESKIICYKYFYLPCCNQLNTKRIVNRYIVKHFISKLIYCWPSSGSFYRETRSLLQQTGSADEVYQLMARLVTFTNQRVLVVKMFFRGCCCFT